MKYHISADDLIRYIYKEVSFMEKLAIEKAIRRDPHLREQYQELTRAFHQLDELANLEQPNTEVLDNVLMYSKLSNLQTEFSA